MHTTQPGVCWHLSSTRAMIFSRIEDGNKTVLSLADFTGTSCRRCDIGASITDLTSATHALADLNSLLSFLFLSFQHLPIPIAWNDVDEKVTTLHDPSLIKDI